MKYKMNIKMLMPAALIASVLLFSCDKDRNHKGPPKKPTVNSKMVFEFTHSVNGVNIIKDSIMFTNLSGNEYSISDFQYLISDIRLDDYEGNYTELDQYQLIDFSDESTWTMEIKDSVLKGDYKSISYYMGFLAEDNVNNGDYPKLDAELWAFPPIIDGLPAGGYYAFKMNGEYIATGDTTPSPYAINIGSKKLVTNGSNKVYKPNPIIGSLYQSDFVLNRTFIKIEMRFNLGKVFEYNQENLIDLNLYDSDYEKEAKATENVSKNLTNVLTLGDILYGTEIH